MQNKGFVKVFAVLLALVCIFYLSFSFVTRHHEKKAEKIAALQGEAAGQHYLDSLTNEPVYFGVWTLKECREMGIGLGLDLKGGMNVILEVSVPDVVEALADHKDDANFKQAIAQAKQEAKEGKDDFISLFVKDYKAIAPNSNLAELFATQQLRGKVNTKTSDREVEKVLRDEVKAAIDNSFNVIRTRIDRFGVVQPNIQALEGQEGRIMVELPGIKEPERVRKLLQGSANLEFWETYTTSEAVPFLVQLDSKLAAAGVEANASEAKAEEAAEVAETTAEADAAAEVADSAKATADDALAAIAKGAAAETANAQAEAQSAQADEQALKQHPLLARLQVLQQDNGACVGYASKRDLEAISALFETPEAKAVLPTDMKLLWGVKGIDKNDEVYELYAIKVTERNGRAPLEGDVVTDAKDEYDQNSRPCVSMQMNVEGARRWAALTKANVHRPIAIVLDNYVYSAPNVQNEITGGNSQITGNFTAEDTRDLANVLKSGKMPAPANIVSEEIVGPTLGQESIRQGFISIILAFIALMLYMVAMYGFRPGMVANCALLFNLFFTLGILTSFQAALTMSGIAGMVLTLGMAVDANVLIFERTKEEMRGGKPVRQAMQAGYSNAFSAIIDSNVTSILTGIILYYFGTGPIRGFATTYIIGIIISFFTAVYLTRVVFDSMMSKEKWLDLTFTTPLSRKFLSNTNYNFMGAYKRSFAIFGAIVLLAVVSWANRGFSRSIDFTGGRNFVVLFEKEVSPESVRPLFAEAFPESNTSVIALGTEGKTLRISTNYRIDEDGMEVDSEIEQKLFDVLKQGGQLSSDLTVDNFINRDERAGGSIISSQKVGPSIAENITRGAIISVILALIVIFVYILVRFRNWAFSFGAITALAVDTIFILGMYSACWGWMPFSLEIDQTFIGALLTCIGYSINDKVVVFDRIRENLGLYPKRDKQLLFNQSLNATLTRTINTSVSTFIVLLFIFAFGGASIRSFAFAMMLGVVIGTLTSMFIAAPVAYLIMGSKIKEKEA
ncbi:MAG: protein translocase subunit SecDF [Bacteroidaceae bacterium]|nr:protein translocase subunit SecDF [Bacteroidaceae bacterium]